MEQEGAQEGASNTNKEKEGVHTEEGWEGGGRRAKGEATSIKGKYGAHIREADAYSDNQEETHTMDNFREENHLTNRKRRGRQRTIR